MTPVEKRNVMIAIAVAIIILLWLWKKRPTNRVYVTNEAGDLVLPDFGDISIGETLYNIPGITIPELRAIYNQRSSCGCRTIPEYKADEVRYYAPARVNSSAPTIVEYSTLVIAPPKPKVMMGVSWG